jgi:hypothetical protein
MFCGRVTLSRSFAYWTLGGSWTLMTHEKNQRVGRSLRLFHKTCRSSGLITGKLEDEPFWL